MVTAYEIPHTPRKCENQHMGTATLRTLFRSATPGATEWPTLLVLAVTYLVWAIATIWLPTLSLPFAILVAAIAIAQFSSVQHEAIHGHPFKSIRLNALLVAPALTLILPYTRFRDTHLDHHLDSRLTDPYDDPESNYIDPGDWDKMSRFAKAIRTANNTLAGRLLIGPLLGTACFLRSDWQNRRADPRVLRGWAWHIPALTAVIVWLSTVATIPFWAYGLAAYGGLSLLKIRTFLEHQAHVKARGRTVIIDDQGPLALLFLNNNYHVLHHIHPRIPWYRLPRLFRKNPGRYLSQNDGYFYRSYREVFAKHFLAPKDPVPHPIWRRS